MSLNNKVIIVTGASSGIGAATAIILAREGANVVIVGRNEANLNSVAGKCGEKVLAIKADVTNDTEAAAIIEKTITKFGKLDVLINNAGIGPNSSILDHKHVEVFDEVIKTNLRSVVVLTNQAAAYLMKTQGIIINMSSVVATMVLLEYAAYCASKAALKQYSRVTAAELADKGVRVIIISPGPVDTPMLQTSLAGLEGNKSRTALNKLSTPEEIGEMISFIASDKVPSITGSEFVIDCGVLLKN